MKYVKMLGLAAVAAMALMAVAGAGASSAAVLCTNNTTNPCTADEPAGTEIVASLTGSAKFENASGGTVYNTCTGGDIRSKTSNTGGTGSPVSAPVSSIAWGTCTNAITTINKGSLAVAWNAGTSNGTVTAKSVSLSFAVSEAPCTFDTGLALDLGTLTGGAEATLVVNATLARTAGGILCPDTLVWTATYKVTNLTPLYVKDK